MLVLAARLRPRLSLALFFFSFSPPLTPNYIPPQLFFSLEFDLPDHIEPAPPKENHRVNMYHKKNFRETTSTTGERRFTASVFMSGKHTISVFRSPSPTAHKSSIVPEHLMFVRACHGSQYPSHVYCEKTVSLILLDITFPLSVNSEDYEKSRSRSQHVLRSWDVYLPIFLKLRQGQDSAKPPWKCSRIVRRWPIYRIHPTMKPRS